MDATPFDILSVLNTLSVIKYTAASALIISIWDVLVTTDLEVRSIWPLPFGSIKALFFFVRYGNIGALIYVNHIYSGIVHPSTDIQCKAFQATYDSLMVLNSCLYNAFVALRLYTIWDRRPRVKMILCIALAVVQIPVLVLGGKSVASFANNTTFAPAPISTCVIFKADNLVKVAFGCALVYDVFVIFLATCNALDRPRRPQHKVVSDLHRDGAIWFFVLLGLRLINFLFFLLLPTTKVFCGIFLTWSLIAITLARMIMRIEITKSPFVKASSRRFQVKTWVPAQDMFELGQGNWVGTASGNTQE